LIRLLGQVLGERKANSPYIPAESLSADHPGSISRGGKLGIRYWFEGREAYVDDTG